MECDVTPDCINEVDPLDTCDEINPLDTHGMIVTDDNPTGGSLNVQIINHEEYDNDSKKSINDNLKNLTTNVNISKSTRIQPPAKVIKHHHSLRRNIPRLVVKSLPTNKIDEHKQVPPQQPSTMREVLASIPGLSIKRRRTNKKMSTAAQIEQTREGCIDLETPDSILVGTNLRELLNKHTFSILPPFYQLKLVQLLPSVDQPSIDPESHGIRLSSSSLNNEFFARACLEWRERLAEGEFTPENQSKLKSEAEREKSKLDPWKLKHFEPIWGEKGQSAYKNDIALSQRPAIKTTIKLNSTTSITTSTTTDLVYTADTENKNDSTSVISNYNSTPPTTPKRIRTVGAVTRAVTGSLQQSSPPSSKISNPVPDLLPIRTKPNSTLVENNSEEQIKDDSKIKEVYIADDIEEPISPSQTIKLEVEDDEEEVMLVETSSPHPVITNENNDNSLTDIKLEYVDDGNKSDGNQVEEEFNNEIDGTITEKMLTNENVSEECEINVIQNKKDENHKNENVVQETNIVLNNLCEDSTSVDSSRSVSLTCDSDGIESSYCPSNTESKSMDNFNDDSCKNILIEDIDSKDYYTIETNDLENNESVKENLKEQVNSSSKEYISENIYNIQSHQQTFDGVLQIQPNSLILQQDGSNNIHHHHHHHHSQVTLHRQQHSENEIIQNEDEISIVDSSVATCDEGSNSNSTNIDGSGDNSMDTAVDELEPSIQNIPLCDDELNEKNEMLTDAENYIKESGEITVQQSRENTGLHQLGPKLCGGEDIQADLFAAAVARALDTVPNVPVAMTVVNPTENTEVIPMQETLEVRLEESTFRVPADWNYNIKMETNSDDLDSMDTTVISNEHNSVITQRRNSYSTASQVKLELEVTLTPEAEVSSTVLNNSTRQSSEDVSSESNHSQFSKMNTIVPTVIPPTTIVCLPSSMTPSNQTVVHNPITSIQQSGSLNNIIDSKINLIQNDKTKKIITIHQPKKLPQHLNQQVDQSNVQFQLQQQQVIMQQTQNRQQIQNNSSANIISQTKLQPNQRAAVVASSSSVPYLSLSTSQPVRAVTNTLNRPKAPSNRGGGRGNRTNSNKPPPGAVNLERSYQICQAVIQNSPNRHQLRCQLRPPPSILAAQQAASSVTKKEDQTQYSAVTSSNKLQSGPRMGFPKKSYAVQRQSSPVLVRHVFTSNQGIPVSMALLPTNNQSGQHVTVQSQSLENISGNTGVMNNVGQYVLVQRAGVNDNAAPRASSAPPAQNQQIHGVNGVPMSGRGRPASVDVDQNSLQETQTISSNIQIHSIGRRGSNQGISFSDISVDPTIQNFAVVSGENTPPNCSCSLNPMVICQQCGAFCHDDCVGSTKLCVSCVIR